MALVLLVLGFRGTADSFANVAAKIDPARGYALASDNGVILARYAQDAFSRKPSSDPQSLPAQLARRALIADATAADALTVLGFQAQLRGEIERSDQLFAYSTELSRRELRPRLWAIEDAVARGDIAEALRNYDIALRTSREAPGMLYPVLGAALAEPRVRAELLRVLTTRPLWTDEFLDYVARRGIEPEGVIALLAEGKSFGVRANDDLRPHLVNGLLAQDKPLKAWAYYRTYRQGAQRDRSRDAAFAQTGTARAAFDWNTGDDPRLGAAILSEGDDGVLDFSVPPNAGGVLVSQTQLLPPGVYRLQGRSRDLEQSGSSRPYWSLSCANGRALGRVVVPNSKDSGGLFSGRFTVPQGCTVQTLSLVARPTNDILGVTGQIDRAQLERIS